MAFHSAVDATDRVSTIFLLVLIVAHSLTLILISCSIDRGGQMIPSLWRHSLALAWALLVFVLPGHAEEVSIDASQTARQVSSGLVSTMPRNFNLVKDTRSAVYFSGLEISAHARFTHSYIQVCFPPSPLHRCLLLPMRPFHGPPRSRSPTTNF